MKSRRERRAEARESGVQFEPQYKGRVITKVEYDEEKRLIKEERKEIQKKLKARFSKAVVEEVLAEENTENSLGE